MATTRDTFLRAVQKKLAEIEARLNALNAELESLTSQHQQYSAAKDVYEREMADKIVPSAVKRGKVAAKKGPTIADRAIQALDSNGGPMGTKQLFDTLNKQGIFKGKHAYSTLVKTLSRDKRFEQPGRAQWDLASRLIAMPLNSANSSREALSMERSQAV